jgi:hypothetical protein
MEAVGGMFVTGMLLARRGASACRFVNEPAAVAARTLRTLSSAPSMLPPPPHQQCGEGHSEEEHPPHHASNNDPQHRLAWSRGCRCTGAGADTGWRAIGVSWCSVCGIEEERAAAVTQAHKLCILHNR